MSGYFFFFFCEFCGKLWQCVFVAFVKFNNAFCKMICNCYIQILNSVFDCFVPFAVYKKVFYFFVCKSVVAFAAVFIQRFFEFGNFLSLSFDGRFVSFYFLLDFRLLRKFILFCVLFNELFIFTFCLAQFFFCFFDFFFAYSFC